MTVLPVVVVPPDHAFVIERGGNFRTVLGAGRHVVAPFVDKVRARIDLGPQILSFPPRLVAAGDGGEVQVLAVVHFRIADPRAATYEIAQPALAIEQLTVTALRQEIGLTTAERAIASPADVHRSVWTVLHETTPRWGVVTTELELEVSPVAVPETPSTAQDWY